MILICVKRLSKYCQKSSTSSPHRSSTFQDWVCPQCVSYLRRKYDIPADTSIPSATNQDIIRFLRPKKVGG